MALVEASDDAGARCAPGVRLRARRRAEGDRQSAGAVRLWLARRRGRAAGAGQGRRRPAPAAPVANPQAEVRRDYELALQIGNKGALGRLPRAVSRRLLRQPRQAAARQDAAEEARVAATEKARQAEQERARLAAEGAQKDAAGQGGGRREGRRAGAHCGREGQAGRSRTGGRRRAEAGRSRKGRRRHQECRGCARPAEPGSAEPRRADAGVPQADINKSVQTELRRVGCLTRTADGNWNTTSQRSLALFNRYARTRFDIKLAAPMRSTRSS